MRRCSTVLILPRPFPHPASHLDQAEVYQGRVLLFQVNSHAEVGMLHISREQSR
jgi:hypothetical protein